MKDYEKRINSIENRRITHEKEMKRLEDKRKQQIEKHQRQLNTQGMILSIFLTIFIVIHVVVLYKLN